MEVANDFKGYGVYIEYADRFQNRFVKGDVYKSVEEFVDKIRYAIDIDDYKFDSIREDRIFCKRSFKLIMSQPSGYKFEVCFRLILNFNRNVAKAIEDMV